MSTSTPRLQLTKPVGNESMILGAAQLADAYAKIDAAMGVKKFATQGAATATFNGDLILETSTGQSKLFNSPNWPNIYDPNSGQGNTQICPNPNDSDSAIGGAETNDWTTILNVEAGRKYLAQWSYTLQAVYSSGALANNKGYVRLNWKYTTNLSIFPNTLVHDAAVFVSAATAARTKTSKGMFEFFPNITGQVKFGLTFQVLTGSQNVRLGQSGTNPSLYLTDWGV